MGQLSLRCETFIAAFALVLSLLLVLKSTKKVINSQASNPHLQETVMERKTNVKHVYFFYCAYRNLQNLYSLLRQF